MGERDGQKCAMKMFILDGISDARMIEKTKAEYEVVKGLDCNLIMKYFEFQENATWTKSSGNQKQVCYLVMELLDGVELLELLNECQEQDDSFIRYIFLQIGNAIH